MKISLCIATCRRPERLGLLLEDLCALHRLPDEVVVVDNDPKASAMPAILARRTAGTRFPILYELQPHPNISMTRNRTVALASGDWLAFVDDDERVPRDWLDRMLACAQQFGADGVLGPVDPVVPEQAPGWIRRGRFYDFPRLETGASVPLNRLRFGNVLLRAAPLRLEPGPFDPAYGLATGEDGDLLVRLVSRGCRIVWCDEAVVHEPIEAARLSWPWLRRRAYSGGQEFARKTLAGRYGAVGAWGKLKFFLRCLVQMAAAPAIALLLWPLGRHRAVAWLLKAVANLGKLSVFWGFRYEEYARDVAS